MQRWLGAAVLAVLLPSLGGLFVVGNHGQTAPIYRHLEVTGSVNVVGEPTGVVARADGTVISPIQEPITPRSAGAKSGLADAPSALVAIDPKGKQVTSVIDLGNGFPGQVALSPDGGTAYVPVAHNSGAWVADEFNRLGVVHLDHRSMVGVPLGVPGAQVGGAVGVAVAPDGNRVFVTDRLLDRLFVVDARSLAVDRSVPIGGAPTGVAALPSGAGVLVVSGRGGRVDLVDPSTGTIVSTVHLPAAAPSISGAVAVSPDGTRAYVTRSSDSHVVVLGLDKADDSLRVAGTIPTTGRHLGDIRVRADGRLVYVVSEGTRQLLVLDENPASDGRGTQLAALAAGAGPVAVAAGDVSGIVAYVGDRLGSAISLVGFDDRTPPTLAVVLQHAPGSAGWSREPVTVTWKARDPESGIATECKPTTVSDDTSGRQTSCTVTNGAGLTTTRSVTVRMDRTAPVISATATTGGVPYLPGTLAANPVVVRFACTDSGSGVATVSDPVTVTSSSERTVRGSCTDLAGNTTSTTVGGIAVAGGDGSAKVVAELSSAARIAGSRSLPTTTADAPAGWARGPVTVTLSASGAAQTLSSLDGGPAVGGNHVRVTGDGDHLLRYWSVNAGGAAETAHETHVRIDAGAPRVVATVDGVNAAGWGRGAVTVMFTCSDDASGAASCPATQTLNAEGGGQRVSGTAVDRAGNRSTASVVVGIDRTAPAVAFVGDAGSYTVEQQVAIGCQVSDGLSGVASSSCSGVDQPAWALALGQSTMTATVTDVAGNVALVSARYNVQVTNTSLCTLESRFATDPNTSSVLCTWTNKVSADRATNNQGSATSAIKNYDALVNNAVGSSLTVGQGDVLIRLVHAL